MRTAQPAAAHARRALVAAVLLVGCADPTLADPAALGEATLEIDGRRIDLQVVTCGLIDGRFPDSPPPMGSERTLTATGETGTDGPIVVSVRRTRDEVAPEQVQTVEISLGDPEVAVQALVLYRGLDEATGRWSEIDPDASDPRVEVPGPLLDVNDASLRAEGSVSLSDGERVMVRLDARCPVVADGTPGVA